MSCWLEGFDESCFRDFVAKYVQFYLVSCSLNYMFVVDSLWIPEELRKQAINLKTLVTYLTKRNPDLCFLHVFTRSRSVLVLSYNFISKSLFIIVIICLRKTDLFPDFHSRCLPILKLKWTVCSSYRVQK